jgi:hypothetical protein
LGSKSRHVQRKKVMSAFTPESGRAPSVMSAKGQKRTCARLIAKIAARYANRLRLLQWFWRFQLFATRRLTTDRDTELCKYRFVLAKNLQRTIFFRGGLAEFS